MKLPFRTLLAELSGRGEQRFVALLVGQVDATTLGAKLVRDVVTGRITCASGLREQIREIEHQGDEQRRLVILALSNALVTPIDREDLFRFSNGIDDVLDNLRDFSREWDLYEMKHGDFFAPLLDEVIQGMEKLRTVVSNIADDPAAIPAGALDAKKVGTHMRRHYQVAMAQLFKEAGDGPATIEVLKRRELLRRLDIVGLRIRETAVLLADAAVKRSH